MMLNQDRVKPDRVNQDRVNQDRVRVMAPPSKSNTEEGPGPRRDPDIIETPRMFLVPVQILPATPSLEVLTELLSQPGKL